MITAFRALVRKDLRLFLTDRRAVAMSFVAPILIGAFFGYVFGGNGGKTEVSPIPVQVVDLDGSAISRDVVARLSSEKTLGVKTADEATARAAVKKGSASVAIVIPASFGTAAAAAFFNPNAKKPDIPLYYDPTHGAEEGMVQGILTGAVMQSVSKEMFSGQTGRQTLQDSMSQLDSAGLPDSTRQSLSQLLSSARQLNESSATAGGGFSAGMTMPYQIREEAATARAGVVYNGYAHSFGGMAIQFILFMGIDAGIAMLLQKQRGLWKRFRAAPLSKSVLLGSRALSSALISMLILLVVFGFARLVFGVRIEGSFAGFLGVCVAFSLMTAAFGLLIAALGKTPEATRGLAILVTIVLVMLGGAWVPAFIFPKWLQTVTLAMPTRWAMDGLDATVWRGLPFSSAVAPIGVLLLSTAIFGFIAVMRFRWEAES